MVTGCQETHTHPHRISHTLDNRTFLTFFLRKILYSLSLMTGSLLVYNYVVNTLDHVTRVFHHWTM